MFLLPTYASFMTCSNYSNDSESGPATYLDETNTFLFHLQGRLVCGSWPLRLVFPFRPIVRTHLVLFDSWLFLAFSSTQFPHGEDIS